MTTDALVLPAAVRDALLDHAREGVPEEVCGVLVGDRSSGPSPGGNRNRDVPGDRSRGTPEDGSGDEGGDARRRTADVVRDTRRVPNVADRPRTRYELDPEATVEAIEAAEAEGRDVVGFYHSHPRGPAELSETDRTRATWTGYVYAIVVPSGTIRAWRWTGEAFDPLNVIER